MKHPDRNIIRLANDIRDELLALQRRQILSWSEHMKLVTTHLESLMTIQRKLILCRPRRFYAAAQHVREQSVRMLPDLICEIEALKRVDQRPLASVPSTRDLVDEIHQLDQEFDGYEYNTKLHTLSVSTDPIELAGIELGPFLIKLHLPKLAHLDGNREVYDVEALEPHPAATDSSVIHPHVRDNRLCEGDAAAPIRMALQSGRICDVFLMIRSVLQTYNEGSPYVPMDRWEGRTCDDCGYVMNEDHSYYCESCDRDYCEDCISYCRHCDSSVCRGCLEECPHCHDSYCHRCLEKCSECRKTCCPSCLEEGLCPDCLEEQERNQREQEERQTAEQSIVSTHYLP